MDKPIELSSPLGDDVLKFLRMTGTEELGRLFEFQLDLVSEKRDVSGEDLLGQSMTIRLGLLDGGIRYFNGLVTQFSYLDSNERTTSYRAVLRPWFWFLTQTADCRIFQGKSVPDIVLEVLKELGFTDVKNALVESYPALDYCVQYRETDFNFLSRLMEEVGIYYYFEHEDDKHTLILCDSASAHGTTIGYEAVRFLHGETTSPKADHLYDWNVTQRVRSGKYTLNDFDFENPSSDISSKHGDPRKHVKADQELYDYPGRYLARSDGEGLAKVRLQELHAAYEVTHGTGFARGLQAGHLFSLSDHPLDRLNREYLIVSSMHQLYQEEFESKPAEGGVERPLTYVGNVVAIESQTPYRSARTAEKPIVQGPQTAMVVGKAGEEIYTDKYGRIKVQFHWDRYGGRDENSSCWIRVAQVWAGKSWGAMHVPRIGQEVIVEFLDGDPDRPIATGRVYNAESMPPYELPGNMTQSGLKSRSTKGGTGDNFNEIRFEDLKGEEHMYIHAEKDQGTVVENDQAIEVGRDRTEGIGRDRSLAVGRDKSERVDRDKSIQVASNHTEQIGSAMMITVGSTLTETVTVNYAENVGGAMEVTVGGAMAVTVGGVMATTVGGSATHSVGANQTAGVGGNYSVDVGKDAKESVGGGKTAKVEKDLKESVGGKMTTDVEEDLVVNAKKIQLIAKDEVSIKAGKAEIILKKSGDISIKGKKINVKGSSDVIVKGSKIKEN